MNKIVFGDARPDVPSVSLPQTTSERLGIGIHANIPEAIYHADPAPEPSASASILKKLHRQSPEHAWQNHPRLNPAFEPSASTDAKDAGTILHSMILGTPAPYRVFDFDSWRGKNADIRDETRAAGYIPILTRKLEPIAEAGAAARRRIRRDFPDLDAALDDPETLKEATLICRINGIMCRCRVDILPPARYGFIADLKFTGLDAPPAEYERTVKRDYRIQSDLYARAVKELRGDLPEFRFYASEEEPPHGMAHYMFGPGAKQRNRDITDAALAKWAACLAASEWPGYPTMLHTIEDDDYEERRDMERSVYHGMVARSSKGLIAKIHQISAEIGGPLQ